MPFDEAAPKREGVDDRKQNVDEKRLDDRRQTMPRRYLGQSKVVDTHSVYLESPHIGDLEVLQLFYPHWRGEAHAKDGPDDAKAAEEQ